MDDREAILVRLVEIAAGIEGVRKTYRNHGDEIPEKSRPAILVIDSDEQADDADPARRPVTAPRRVTMTPEMYILLGAASEDVGTQLNQFRARLIKAVFADAILQDLTVNGDGIRYEASATALSRGRSMEGEMGVSISFTYRMFPELLVEDTTT